MGRHAWMRGYTFKQNHKQTVVLSSLYSSVVEESAKINLDHLVIMFKNISFV